jgi:hypothetical protein
MAEDRTFCPHCYAPIIAKRKTCPKCGRNVSDAPPTSKAPLKQAASGSATFAVLGALVVIVAVTAWVLLR